MVMITNDAIRLDVVGLEQEKERLRAVGELVEPEIQEMKAWGESAVVDRYLEDYKKMSLLVGQYVSLLKEDLEYVCDAAGELLVADRQILC